MREIIVGERRDDVSSLSLAVWDIYRELCNYPRLDAVNDRVPFRLAEFRASCTHRAAILTRECLFCHQRRRLSVVRRRGTWALLLAYYRWNA